MPLHTPSKPMTGCCHRETSFQPVAVGTPGGKLVCPWLAGQAHRDMAPRRASASPRAPQQNSLVKTSSRAKRGMPGPPQGRWALLTTRPGPPVQTGRGPNLGLPDLPVRHSSCPSSSLDLDRCVAFLNWAAPSLMVLNSRHIYYKNP